MKWTGLMLLVGLAVVALEPWIAWLGWFIAAISIVCAAAMYYSTRRSNVVKLEQANREARETIAKMAPIVASVGVLREENKDLRADIKRMVEVNAEQDKMIQFQREMIERMELSQKELMKTVELQGLKIQDLRDQMMLVARFHPEVPTHLLKWD